MYNSKQAKWIAIGENLTLTKDTVIQGDSLSYTNADGTTSTLNLSALKNQNLIVTPLDGNNIAYFTLSNDKTHALDLSSLAVSPEKQDITLTYDSSTASLTVGISGGTSQTISLSSLAGSGTATQSLAVSTLGGNNTMTLAISKGNTITLDFSPLAASGLVSITENGKTGYRLADANPVNHGDIGAVAVDLSIQIVGSTRGARGDASTAFGFGTTALGYASTAFGQYTGAAGEASTAFGHNATASGNRSTAFGSNTRATATFSTAFESTTTALATNSTAFGLETTAESFGQTSLGAYNTAHPGTPNTGAIVPTDRLLVVGNGTSVAARSDALVILKNGNTELNGTLTLNPTGTSSYTLPTAKGTAGQVLAIENAASGTTTWTTVSSSTGTQSLAASPLSGNNTMTLAISEGNTVTLDFSPLAASGLVSITEGGNAGHRLATVNPANHGDIGANAVDLSSQTAASTSTGARGEASTSFGRNTTASERFSAAFGFGTTASGRRSTAFGRNTIATGDTSTAFGYLTTASGNYSIAFGADTKATGDDSTVFGRSTTAESYGQTTFGTNNTLHPGTPNTSGFVATDRLFVIGNGTSTVTTSDALVILKNGNTELNGTLTLNPSGTSSYTLPTAKGTTGQVLAIENAASGTTTWTNRGALAKVTEGVKTGYRLAEANPANHGDIGKDAVDLSIQTGLTGGAIGDYSASFGRNTTASNYASVAFGHDTVASGLRSTAFGFSTTASGSYSTAFGVSATALGTYSTAFGGSTTASATYTTAFGEDTTAESRGQISLGMYNTPHPETPNATGITSTDRLLVVGNGTSSVARSDALVILKNGNVGIGVSNPVTYTLDVAGDINTSGDFRKNGVVLPDYVFEKYFGEESPVPVAYEMLSLQEVEAFVKANKHLPGVQSRKDLETQGSWNVSENVRTNLEKVEELYLHTIEQQKQLESQKKEIESQQKEMQDQQKQIENQQQEMDLLKSMLQQLLEKE